MLSYFSHVTAAVCNYSAPDAAAITRELEQLGARVLERYTPACTHLLTPYRSGAEYDAALADGKTVVSYGARSAFPRAPALPLTHAPGRAAWLEDCLAARRVLSPEAKVLYAPIQDAHGVPGMAGVVVAAAGYAGPARADIRELAEASGATFSGALTRATTHLVCYRPDAEIYTKALLARLEGRPLEIVNHRWLEDTVRAWARQPESAEPYRRLGCEVDADARIVAERERCREAEAHAAAAARRAAELQAAFEAEAEARAHAHAHVAHLSAELDAARGGAAAEAGQAAASRSDVEALQALLAASEAARSQLQRHLASADEDRRAGAAALEAATAQQAALTAQFARSRGDLLAQLEGRLATIEALTAQLDAAHKQQAGTQGASCALRRCVSLARRTPDPSARAAALSDEQARHRATSERLEAEARRAAGLVDALAAAERDKASVAKQLDAERKSRLHVLSDFESERRQREHLIRQLDAEQKLRASLQKAVSAKDELRMKAEEELSHLSRDLDGMAAELSRLRAFEPRNADPDSRIQVKLFLDDEIRFLEVDADAGFEHLTAAVGKVVAESYRLAFEDEARLSYACCVSLLG